MAQVISLGSPLAWEEPARLAERALGDTSSWFSHPGTTRPRSVRYEIAVLERRGGGATGPALRAMQDEPGAVISCERRVVRSPTDVRPSGGTPTVDPFAWLRRHWVLAALMVVTLVRGALAARIGLHVDEAYYWE